MEKTTLHLFNINADDVMQLFNSKLQHLNITVDTHQGGWETIEIAGENIRLIVEEIVSFFPQVIAGDVVKGIIELLKKHNKTITVAESCSGGRVASLITSVSGSSAVFNGSVVTYSNRLKHLWLKVSETSLNTFGAVSSYVVQEMAQGILKMAGANHALAISGIAGPAGGSREKPVGTVYIAYTNDKGVLKNERLFLKGDRNTIQTGAAYNALRLFVQNCHL